MRARRIDSNQNEIVKALRKCGFSVAVTSRLGEGFPDLVVGAKGVNYLFELKDGNKSPSRKRLTEDEEKFFNTWQGRVYKVEKTDEIITIINK